MWSLSSCLKMGAVGPTKIFGELFAVLYTATSRTFTTGELQITHIVHYVKQAKLHVLMEDELLECRPSNPILHKQSWSIKGMNKFPEKFYAKFSTRLPRVSGSWRQPLFTVKVSRVHFVLCACVIKVLLSPMSDEVGKLSQTLSSAVVLRSSYLYCFIPVFIPGAWRNTRRRISGVAQTFTRSFRFCFLFSAFPWVSFQTQHPKRHFC